MIIGKKISMKAKKETNKEWCENFPMECTCGGRGKCLNEHKRINKRNNNIDKIIREKYG